MIGRQKNKRYQTGYQIRYYLSFIKQRIKTYKIITKCLSVIIQNLFFQQVRLSTLIKSVEVWILKICKKKRWRKKEEKVLERYSESRKEIVSYQKQSRAQLVYYCENNVICALSSTSSRKKLIRLRQLCKVSRPLSGLIT